jgi:hypothetical protein
MKWHNLARSLVSGATGKLGKIRKRQSAAAVQNVADLSSAVRRLRFGVWRCCAAFRYSLRSQIGG